MDSFDFAKKASKTVLKEAASQNTSAIGSKTMSEWDKEWAEQL